MQSQIIKCLFLKRHDFDDTGKPLTETQEEIAKHELVIVYLVGHEPIILKNHYDIANKNATSLIQFVITQNEWMENSPAENNNTTEGIPPSVSRWLEAHVGTK